MHFSGTNVKEKANTMEAIQSSTTLNMGHHMGK